MNKGDSGTSGEALLATLSDDLALPLLQIRSSLELLDGTKLSAAQQKLVESLGLSTQAGLKLVEAYRLALSLSDATQLPLEPVAIGAVLSDVAHELSPLADTYNVELWVDVQPSLKPVLAHQPSLAVALNCLSGSLIRAQAAKSKKKSRLLLGAHRYQTGEIITGAYGSSHGISTRALRAARALSGRARQPIADVPAGTASGVLVADMLCSKVWQPLRTARHQNLQGLATLVPVSHQLNLI